MRNFCRSSTLLSASLLLALLGSTRGGNLAETVEFREFIYEGLRNVRWEGNKETWNVGNPQDQDTNVTEAQVENHCAALCTARESDCTGFYIDHADTDGACHLVKDDADGSPTIGHGWRWLDVFYNKTSATYDAFASPPPSFNLTDELTTPCDQDEEKLAVDVCATYNNATALAVEYMNCSRVTDNYPNTVNLISDLRCAGEDRLLQCELDGRQVDTGLPDNVQAFDNMFFKSWMYGRGLEVMSYGEVGGWVHMKLPKAPRKLTRMILRTVDTQEVEHMRLGEVIIYGQGGNVQTVQLDFTANVLACVVHINFNKYPSITFAQEAYAVNITNVEWKGIIKKKGFKIDLFIEDKNM